MFIYVFHKKKGYLFGSGSPKLSEFQTNMKFHGIWYFFPAKVNIY